MHLLHAAELSACAATFSLGGANATAEAAARAECEADFVSHGGGSRREPTPRGLSPLSVLSEETLFEPTVLISLVTAAVVLGVLLLFVVNERRLRRKFAEKQRQHMIRLPSSARFTRLSSRLSKGLEDASHAIE